MEKYIKFSLLLFSFLGFSSFLLAKPLILLQETNNMNSQNIYFAQANELLDKFNKEPSQLYAGDLIKEAIAELNKINLDTIKGRQEYKTERQQWLVLHLKIVATIDQYYNPNGAPTFFLNVLPPEIDGNYYPAPIDPKEIKDPKKRADYEQQIQENEKNKREADLQITIQRLLGKEPDLDPKASYIEELKRKIPDYYSKYAEDKKEYKIIIEQSQLTLDRKKEFSKLLN